MDRAKALTGTRETTTLVRRSLETLIRDEFGNGLIALGATIPDADAAPSQQSDAYLDQSLSSW